MMNSEPGDRFWPCPLCGNTMARSMTRCPPCGANHYA